jgi:hypothetical protein
MDRAREAGQLACPLLVVRLGRNAGCHLGLDITFPPFRMLAPLSKLIDWTALQVAYAIALRSAKVLRTDSPLAAAFGPKFGLYRVDIGHTEAQAEAERAVVWRSGAAQMPSCRDTRCGWAPEACIDPLVNAAQQPVAADGAARRAELGR